MTRIDGHKALAAFVLLKAMKDVACYDMIFHKGAEYCTVHDTRMTREDIRDEAEEWLCESAGCQFFIDCLDWPFSGVELAEMAKNGQMEWTKIQHVLSRLLVSN